MKNKETKFFNKKKFLLVIFIIILFFAFVNGPISQAGEDVSEDKYGLDATVKEGFGEIPEEADISSIIGKIIGAGLSFIGILFFILVIYGGYLWMTARGNEEQVGKAIDLVAQAAIGLIIVAAAYLITRFVGETVLNKVIGPGK